MNWNQLRYVITVAEEGSVTRAAQKLYLAQPSLSLSIKSLEQELELALFAREQGMLMPTYAGELFVEWAKATLRSYDQLTLKLADIAGERRSLLRVGISPHRSAILMPAILEQFYGAHPECEVRLIEQPTYVLRDYLESGKLDVMVDTPHPDTNAYRHRSLCTMRGTPGSRPRVSSNFAGSHHAVLHFITDLCFRSSLRSPGCGAQKGRSWTKCLEWPLQISFSLYDAEPNKRLADGSLLFWPYLLDAASLSIPGVRDIVRDQTLNCVCYDLNVFGLSPEPRSIHTVPPAGPYRLA